MPCWMYWGGHSHQGTIRDPCCERLLVKVPSENDTNHFFLNPFSIHVCWASGIYIHLVGSTPYYLLSRKKTNRSAQDRHLSSKVVSPLGVAKWVVQCHQLLHMFTCPTGVTFTLYVPSLSPTLLTPAGPRYCLILNVQPTMINII